MAVAASRVAPAVLRTAWGERMTTTSARGTPVPTVRVSFDVSGSTGGLSLRRPDLFELGFPNASDPTKPAFYNATAVLVAQNDTVRPDTIEVQLRKSAAKRLPAGAVASHVAYAQVSTCIPACGRHAANGTSSAFSLTLAGPCSLRPACTLPVPMCSSTSPATRATTLQACPLAAVASLAVRLPVTRRQCFHAAFTQSTLFVEARWCCRLRASS